MPELLKKIMNNCDVMMFAAGLGTRLRPATNRHAKPVLPLNQIALGYYALPYLDCLEIKNFVVNTFHLPEFSFSFVYEGEGSIFARMGQKNVPNR